MAFFNIQWRNSTKKDIRSLPPHEVARIIAAVEKLADEPFPHGSEKLSGSDLSNRTRDQQWRR
jgi:mRNA interferase RelE/StbE